MQHRYAHGYPPLSGDVQLVAKPKVYAQPKTVLFRSCFDFLNFFPSHLSGIRQGFWDLRQNMIEDPISQLRGNLDML